MLEPELAEAIIAAAEKVIAGAYNDQFVTDLVQGGAGTSINMNANEVIANIALEHLGHQKGEYQYLHPNNHVNCSQSTNDAYPTAFRLALHAKIELYIASLTSLKDAFETKAAEFDTVLKMGRTQLQDAVPMTLGQEFHGFATAMKEDINRLQEARTLITVVNMGGTAIGTGINTPKGYSALCAKYLTEQCGYPITISADLIEATSDTGDYVQVSSVLKRSVLKISKICNDLRLLSSGPRCGINEINLPQMQPGSSIMPGKVNPVIPEVVNQTAFYVAGADVTISMAAEAGQLQLNVMEPVITFSLFTSLQYMTAAVDTLVRDCINGITANREVSSQAVMNSVGIVTALNPIIGYEQAASIAKEALSTGKSIHEIAVNERRVISQADWDELYSFENMIHPELL